MCLWDWSMGQCKTFDTLDDAAPAEVAVPQNPIPSSRKTGDAVDLADRTRAEGREARSYEGTVTATVEGAAPMKMPLKLNVADWTLTDSKDFQTEVGFHQSWESVAMKYGAPLWSEKHWQLLDKIYTYLGWWSGHVYIYLIRRAQAGIPRAWCGGSRRTTGPALRT